MLIPLLVAFLSSPAHALVGVRVSAGYGGANQYGAAERLGGEGEVWFSSRVAVGARVGVGVDGDPPRAGRWVYVVEPTLPVRLVGGKGLALVVVPGVGVTEVRQPDLPAIRSPGASLWLGVQGHLAFLTASAGPRVETTISSEPVSAATLNLAVGAAF